MAALQPPQQLPSHVPNAVQVARLAHDKFGGAEQLQEHQRARADAKLQSKLRVRCGCHAAPAALRLLFFDRDAC